MIPSIRMVIEESSRTAEARRVARKMADDLGFDETEAERIAIVVTEVCTNLLLHATRGEILLTPTEAHPEVGHGGLELLALDRGPGMGDLNQCLRDGFSTGGSAGQGLGAIMRLSSDSDFYSGKGIGTAILARWSGIPKSKRGSSQDSGRGISVGGVNVPKQGEEVCGDSWGVEQTDDATVILLADGLGHGIDARMASCEAVRILRMNPRLSPKELTERVHQALRSLRGAAVAVARIDLARQRLTFSGVGNISAQIRSGGKASQHLVSVNGTAGHQANGLREFGYPWPDHGILVLHSDGLTTSATLDNQNGLSMRDPSLIAGVLYRDFNRGNDDATVVIAKET